MPDTAIVTVDSKNQRVLDEVSFDQLSDKVKELLLESRIPDIEIILNDPDAGLRRRAAIELVKNYLDAVSGSAEPSLKVKVT